MPDLFGVDYKEAKEKWEKAKKNLDDSITLYDTIHVILKSAHKELEIASKEFSHQQALIVKTSKNLSSINIKSIKRG